MKINFFFSKKDLIYNLDNYNNKTNLLIITGLVGAGKSTLARKIASENNATIFIEDWFSWTECYNTKESKDMINLYIKKYPETKEMFDKFLWRKEGIISEDKRKIYRKEFDYFLINYALLNKKKNFIFEGSSIFKYVNPKDIINLPIIIKRTSIIKSIYRRYKRDILSYDKKTVKNKISLIKEILKTMKQFYFDDRKKLLKFCKKL
ncbi:MAG TPA: hypothetical protein PLC53_03670 [Bacilli bacterium]|nr:hypothetical protein [Bacilli bacterium]